MTSSALEHILQKHHRDAYLWARQCCSFDDDQAKDVLQAVYLKILEGKAKFNEKSSAKTWLFSVIRYTAIDHFKKEKRLEPLDIGLEIPDWTEINTDEPISYEGLIQQLSPMQAQVLLMVFCPLPTCTSNSVCMPPSLVPNPSNQRLLLSNQGA